MHNASSVFSLNRTKDTKVYQNIRYVSKLTVKLRGGWENKNSVAGEGEYTMPIIQMNTDMKS